VSLCHANRYDRNKRFLAVNVGWGQDTKDADYTEKVTINGVRNNIDNKMLTVGAGFYSVALPWLTVGSGAGVAWFSSNRAASFQKLYIEPYIVEVKPLAFTGNSALTPWWRHVLFLSYSTLVFPTGFEAGRFQRSDPRFPAELVHVWGIHADLEPLMRRLAGNW
jgi:hypothetical protein